MEAALDVADAWRASGTNWRDMTREQPLHPSMQRLLDACDTVDHRHHRTGAAVPGHRMELLDLSTGTNTIQDAR